MRWLVVSDFHNAYDKVPQILEKAGIVDGTLLAGDLTQFGPRIMRKNLIDMLPRPILAVPGNCDPREVSFAILEREDVCLHFRAHQLRRGHLCRHRQLEPDAV